MRRKKSKAFFLIFCTLLALMSIPKKPAEKLQGMTVAMLAPAWHGLLAVASYFEGDSEGGSGVPSELSEEMERLQLENVLLREEIVYIKEMMQHELRLAGQMNALLNDGKTQGSLKNLKARHARELKTLQQMHLEAVPARVIFRPPDSWNSSFWINVGSATNDELGMATIVKNSPVLVGTSVIGVIDYVGKRQSRVRLITDSGLTPSIRASRGGIQSKALEEKLHSFLHMLKKMPGALSSKEQQSELIMQLELAAENLASEEKTDYLAKGELRGASESLWRAERHRLKGTGFNYDFADSEGPARDLRTGRYAGQGDGEPSQPVIKVGDLLVTTGMDGVFPPGLMVAEVTKVYPLKEGDYYYELDAFPIAGNFDDVALVFVIPPLCELSET